LKQPVEVVHDDRHCCPWMPSPEEHTCIAGHEELLVHADSCGSWHTPVVPDTRHVSPAGQSLVAAHAEWQRPKAQMRGESQSLLMLQVAETAGVDLQL
jgi:hypothetical protein